MDYLFPEWNFAIDNLLFSYSVSRCVYPYIYPNRYWFDIQAFQKMGIGLIFSISVLVRHNLLTIISLALVELSTVVQVICTQIIDNTLVKWREKPNLESPTNYYTVFN